MKEHEHQLFLMILVHQAKMFTNEEKIGLSDSEQIINKAS